MALTPQTPAAIAAPSAVTPSAQAIPPNASRILWDNVLSPANQSTAVQLALTDNTYERGTAKTFTITLSPARDIDTIAFLGNYAGHTITVRVAATIGGALTTVATVTPSDNRAIMVAVDTGAAVAEIRLTTNQSQMQLSNISAGVALVMQRPLYGGHTPITLSQGTEYQSRRTDTGNFLSRNIVRKGLSTTYSYKNITADWVRDNFMPFKLAARTKPFFIQWRPVEYPLECAYAWTTNDIQVTNQGTRDLMDITMQVQAYGD